MTADGIRIAEMVFEHPLEAANIDAALLCSQETPGA